MDEKIIEEKGAQVAKIIEGLDLMDAVDVIGHAAIAESGKPLSHVLIPIYAIAKMVSDSQGRQGIVQINDDGTVSFVIKSHDAVKKYF